MKRLLLEHKANISKITHIYAIVQLETGEIAPFTSNPQPPPYTLISKNHCIYEMLLFFL